MAQSVFVKYYDKLLCDVDYEQMCKFICEAKDKYAADALCVSDVSCGTGSLAVLLAKRGFDVHASDISEDMLSFAAQKAFESGEKIIFSHQNMRDLILPKQTDIIISTLDSANSLVSSGDLQRFFVSANKNLVSGGLFIFDMNSVLKFENVYADNTYTLEDEKGETFLSWSNFYNKKTRICDFYLTYFCRTKDGKYERYDETLRERAYSKRYVCACLEKCGFELIKVFGGYDGAECSECDERWVFLAKKAERKA
ncbi:MAG: class I SAM-dependent methyltransferase [Clostridia bacterium]|nr:class I SAM-dependent methyltransferase [Clostridia bacterium]